MRRPSEGVDGAARTSPWPILVAVGLATSELGVFVGSVPVSVAGLVLFGGATAGLAHDAGYGASPTGPLVVAGGLLVLAGGGLWTVRAPALTVTALVEVPGTDGIALRGVAILAAGGLLVCTGLVERGTSFLGR